MFQSLEIFRLAGEMARHAGARQAVVAMNIANADTPGYRALTTAPFAETLRSTGELELLRTRPGHLAGAGAADGLRLRPRPAEESPNGNSVSLEAETLAAVEAQRDHSRALALYRHAMTVLRSSLGR